MYGLNLLAGGVPALLLLSPQPPNVAGAALKILRTWQVALGLNPSNTFGVSGVSEDPLLGRVNVRVGQYYRGVRVLGGEAIMHMEGDHVRGFTDEFKRSLDVDIHPNLTASEALALALRDLAPRGPLLIPPTAELVVANMKLGPGKPVMRAALLYHIHTELENGRDETLHMDYLVDAHAGTIAKKWNSLSTAASVATGMSQYSGKIFFTTNGTAQGFEMRDPTRGDAGNTVLNLAHGGGTVAGSIFSSARNVWGDGENYDGGVTTSNNGETAGVDAAYGAQCTWDYYKRVHHRNGIDGSGTATSMRVHYSTGYDNAYWSDSCFCMTFGDGSKFKSLECLDVIGHEMSHGVCASTAALQYFGESGGLNEANSDIHGTMVEFYARGGRGASIGNQGGNWTIGEQLSTARFPRPLRFLYKPSLDGQSPDAWYDGIEALDVHYSSGPMNRCFYFLSQGASSDAASDSYSPKLPKGMKGVGNDKAARIWYRALVNYMTSSTDYAGARQACLSAAQDLYGAHGAEVKAVSSAFLGIAVEAPQTQAFEWPLEDPVE